MRSLQPVLPARNLFRDLLRPLQPCLAFAPDLIKGRSLGHHRDPRGLNRHLDVFNLSPRGIQIAQISKGLFGFRQSNPRRQSLILMPLHRQPRGLHLTFSQIPIGFGTTGRSICLRHQTVRIPSCLPRFLIRFGQIRQPCCQSIMRLRGPNGLRVAFFQIPLQLHQTVQLLQSQRRGRWRILGSRTKSIPAPQIPLNGDQALPGLQIRLQLCTLGRIHQAHLAHAPHQDLWHADIIG